MCHTFQWTSALNCDELRGTVWHVHSVKRVTVGISFLTAQERDAAIRKSKQRGRTLSGQIRWYFSQLPEQGVADRQEMPGE